MDNNIIEDFLPHRRLEFKNNEENHTVSFEEVLQDNSKDIEASIGSEKNIKMIHACIRDEVIPKVGMEFETEEEAYNFYNTYAYNVGFSIRRSKGHKDKDGKMKDRIFCCSCQGFRGTDKRDVNVKRHLAETRFGCLAQIKINSRQTGKYKVVEFIEEHSHVTSSPTKSHLHRSQRKLTAAQAVEIELAEDSGIAPKASLELMVRRAGGRDNLGFTLDDCRNYILTKRTIQMRTGDTGGVLEYLQRMKSEDPNFFLCFASRQ
ncbi:protein FAR1-RELATED SEQUENCE 5-like [Humulus lupulus]|uniref:protein FAR1-RELATED SEQUENCE 5-like n=1 Tax=Humulus lupulus TaxID=3486 RepID=UPI002B417BDD|nr:protein FAR1-RELATED SEQUENCE 5-like [Humulus lupulus]